MAKPSSRILAVPIHVDALCVGERDAEHADTWLANLAPDFTDLVHDRFTSTAACPEGRPFVSHDHLPQPLAPQATGQSRHQAGVHLHWALPDALTHGQVDYALDERALRTLRHQGMSAALRVSLSGIEGDKAAFTQALLAKLDPVQQALYLPMLLRAAARLRYPTIPNRWLVLRVGADSGIQRGWVVESDHLSILPPSGDLADRYSHTAVPAPGELGIDDRFHYRYLGRAVPLERWAEPESETVDSYPQLTALGPGLPQFAATYPLSRSVLGLHDRPPTGSACGYLVIGWHAHPEGEPLRDATAAAARKLGWDASAVGDDTPIAGTVYCGMIDNVSWEPRRDYREEIGGSAAQEVLKLAIGNTPAEALAQLIAGKDQGSKEPGLTAADLLTALQQGLLERVEGSAVPLLELDNALHEKSFHPVPAGALWRITGQAHEAPLPDALVAELDELNRLQESYHEKVELDEAARRQTWADWIRYQWLSYGHRQLLGEDPRQLDALRDALRWQLEDEAGYRDSLTSLAKEREAELGQKLDAIEGQLARLGGALAQHAAAEPDLRLQPATPPRYWQPNEPTLALEGELVRPSPRWGQDQARGEDGLLPCQLLETGAASPQESGPFARLPQGPAELVRWALKQIPNWRATKPEPTWMTARTEHNPWHPLFLEWEIAYRPLHEASGGREDSRPLYDDLLEDQAKLEPHHSELELVDPTLDREHVIRGSSLLTSQVVASLHHHAERLFAAAPDSDEDRLVDLLTGVAEKPVLAQTLTGFHELLLQQRVELQLQAFDPNDPVGVDGSTDRALSRLVAEVVGPHGRATPLPREHFCPIRGGSLEIRRLRVVDSFGQFREIDPSGLLRPRSLLTPDSEALGGRAICLPPRVVPPARLQFRWLAALDGHEEASEQASMSPIHGWIVADHVDSSLAIYAADGEHLGAVTSDGGWEPAPGRSTKPEDIGDPQLMGFTTTLKDHASELIDRIEAAQEGIHPTGHDGGALTVLMGRPLALVRAMIRLDLLGPAPVCQSIDPLDGDGLVQLARSSRGFESVRFPVRLGDAGHPGDGLVGFYLHDAETGVQSSSFVAAQDDEQGLLLRFDGRPLHVTMLVDPRASVHASCGILPLKAIGIPAQQYEPALARMEFTTFTAPVLGALAPAPDGEGRTLTLPVPGEGDGPWTWLSRDDDGRIQEANTRNIDDRVHPDTPAAQALEGWLRIVPFAQNPEPPEGSRT